MLISVFRRLSSASLTATVLAASATTAANAKESIPPGQASPPSAPHAQPASTPAGVGSPQDVQPGDIIVTAQKRSEAVNRVGLAITAISGDGLRDRNIQTVIDLAKAVPGLTYANSFTAAPVYSLRGVGYYETSLSAYPDVSVYVDQVPLPFPALTNQIPRDLDRVEVLKGPQGILFGQNSTGGAINYVAKKPTDVQQAGASLSYGRFDDLLADAYVSGPVSSTLSARLSFQSENASPWQRTYHLPVGGVNGAVEKYAGRLLLDWKPVNGFSAELAISGGIDRSEPAAPQLIGFQIQIPGTPAAAALLAYPLAPAEARAADFSPDNKPRSDNRQGQVSLRTDTDVTSDITLTTITSYLAYRRDMQLEYGGTATKADEITQDTGRINSFYQEVRFANGSHERLRWQLGGNYDRHVVDDFNRLDYSGSTETALGIFGSKFYSDQKMRDLAAFANAEYDVVPILTAKAGLRYTNSHRTAHGCVLDDGDGGATAIFNSLAAAFNPPGSYKTLQLGDCISAEPGTFKTDPDGFRGTLDESNVSWRVGADLKPSARTLFYVNVSKGFKAGSFPTVAASSLVQFAPVRQESVLDYEAGFKVGLLNRRVQLNGAIFHYDYRDKQIRSQSQQPIFNLLNNLVNVPKSTVDGAEADLTWQPTRGLQVGLAGTYLDAKVKQFTGYNGAGTLADFSGASVPFTPRFTASGTADYSWAFSRKVRAAVGGSWSHRSASYAVIGGSDIDRINPYDLLDLRASVESADGRYKVQVWGRNVTNQFYWNNVVHAFDTIVRYAEQPATYGVTLAARY